MKKKLLIAAGLYLGANACMLYSAWVTTNVLSAPPDEWSATERLWYNMAIAPFQNN